MKLTFISKNRKHAGKYGQGRRFYTSVDMAIIKHDIAVQNSQVNRGEMKRTNTNAIIVCGCGHEGCFLHINKKS